MSELPRSLSKRKFSGTPMKTLLAQEMSKEVDSKQSPPNLVAKLMGLDTLPMQLPCLISQRSRSNGYIQHNRSKSLTGTKVEHCHHGRSYSEMQMLHGYAEYGDYSDVYDMWQQSQKGSSIRENPPETANEKKMALVRQKFMEAKCLASDEKLRQSKQFQDAVEVLRSNRDLFLKFLQEPNSLISRHLHELQSFPPPPETQHITILKPSKMADDEQRTKRSSLVSGYPLEDVDGYAAQPTRIVLLKPGHGKVPDAKSLTMPPSASPETFHEDNLFHRVEDEKVQEPQEVAKEISENLTEYVDGNLSDSEAMSPTPRHSWEFLNRVDDSPCSVSSAFSRASYSPESSVCREAKKRLSERWALMASKQSSVEQTHHRSSSTLGEMLALSNGKESIPTPSSPLRAIEEARVDSPRNLSRSKSEPASSSTLRDDTVEVLNEPTKKMNGKSSLKWRLSSLFFSRSSKSKKESSTASQSKDELHSKCAETPDSTEYPHAEVGSSLSNHLAHGRLSDNHDQPSPMSVLDHFIEEDQKILSFDKNMSGQSLRSNLIDKSPPIGSISRTLSWNEACLGSTSPRPTKPMTVPSFTEEEKQDLLDFIETLLSSLGPTESPLDPSLMDKLSDKEPVNEAKRRRWRSYHKLVFDFVNATMTEINRDRTVSICGDHLWVQMKGWFCDEGSCVYGEEDEDDRPSLVVERDAVVGEGWSEEHLRLEIGNLGMEIEGELMEQLLDEAVGDLFGTV